LQFGDELLTSVFPRGNSIYIILYACVVCTISSNRQILWINRSQNSINVYFHLSHDVYRSSSVRSILYSINFRLQSPQRCPVKILFCFNNTCINYTAAVVDELVRFSGPVDHIIIMYNILLIYTIIACSDYDNAFIGNGRIIILYCSECKAVSDFRTF